jgi:hypothetical protein
VAKNLSMLGFRRASMPRGTAFKTGNQIVIQIADVQISGHSSARECIESNDLISDPTRQ